jgi:nitrilase
MTKTFQVRRAAAYAAPVFVDKTATIKKTIRPIKQGQADEVKVLVSRVTFIPRYPYFIQCSPPLRQTGALAQYSEESVVSDTSPHPTYSLLR